jgi:hypothetical protein
MLGRFPPVIMLCRIAQAAHKGSAAGHLASSRAPGIKPGARWPPGQSS